MNGYDADGYQVYERPSSVNYVEHLERDVLYPGGARVTWAKSRPPQRSYFANPAGLSPEPEGAAAERRRDRADDKTRERDGQVLVPIDPNDPWSEAHWVKPN